MKNILFTLTLLASLVSFGFAQNPIKDVPQVQETPAAVNPDGPIMSLESMVVDYGTIAQNSEPLRTVAFTNTGKEPLVISNARGSCGCTVPTWPKEPIMPGESADIEVRYATNRVGPFNKKITLTTNEGGQPKVLKVTGTVLKEEKEESVPASEPSMLNPGGGK